ncbi:MAG: putative toxin-antitoxin system toxin component, PIN family [Bdellovibrionales bacterium]
MFVSVIDTNVYLSAFFASDGRAAQCVHFAYTQGAALHSRETYHELSEKMRERCSKDVFSDARIQRYLAFVDKRSIMLPVEPGITSCKDKTDNKFLDLAVTGKADYIISGDHHLLNMKNIRGIGHTVQIVSPAGLVRAFQESSAFAALRPQHHVLK